MFGSPLCLMAVYCQRNQVEDHFESQIGVKCFKTNDIASDRTTAATVYYRREGIKAITRCQSNDIRRGIETWFCSNWLWKTTYPVVTKSHYELQLYLLVLKSPVEYISGSHGRVEWDHYRWRIVVWKQMSCWRFNDSFTVHGDRCENDVKIHLITIRNFNVEIFTFGADLKAIKSSWLLDDGCDSSMFEQDSWNHQYWDQERLVWWPS